MRLLITEVTEMSTGNYCVAAWRAATQAMVRPLPNWQNWTQASLAQHGVAPGVSIDVQTSGIPANGAYPHRTEDTPIDPLTLIAVQTPPFAWLGPSAPAARTTVDHAFQNAVQNNSVWHNVRQGVHVLAGTFGPSLAGIILPAANLIFTEEFGKLKALINDGVATYKLAVSSRELKEKWRLGGLPSLAQWLPRVGELHVRLGLARAFGNPADKCYMMVNGVQW